MRPITGIYRSIWLNFYHLFAAEIHVERGVWIQIYRKFQVREFSNQNCLWDSLNTGTERSLDYSSRRDRRQRWIPVSIFSSETKFEISNSPPSIFEIETDEDAGLYWNQMGVALDNGCQ